MTVKGLSANSNNKPSVFMLEETSFNSTSPNSGSPSRDVNLNHLNIVNPSQRSPSHNQSQGFSSPNHSNSPTREVPDISSQKSILHLKEKSDDRYESKIEMVKNANSEFVLKSPDKDFDRSLKDVSDLIAN
jgi:hypothetical protein